MNIGRLLPFKREHFSLANVERTIMDLLSAEDIQSSVCALHDKMGRGGGVQAGAALLEQLAVHKSPVESCVDEPCCC